MVYILLNSIIANVFVRLSDVVGKMRLNFITLLCSIVF